MRKRIGLIVLATDHTVEIDFRRLIAGDDIGVYVARIPYANPTTPENLRAMQPALAGAASLILPDEDMDVMAFCCTSASVVIGDDQITAAIRAVKPDTKVVTPTSAAILALRSLRARRISVLTPYTVETSQPMALYFRDKGFDIDCFHCLDLTDDREMARIAREDIVAAAKEAMAPQSDALFISCTSLRSAAVAACIEQVIGKPVVTSNLAMAWACLRFCGEDHSSKSLPTLMSMPLV
jgi:maleate isomerase